MSESRIFDENGIERFPEPVNMDKLEYLGEVGGTLEESSVGINFTSEKLDRQEITDQLGVQPTKAWNPGEKHPIGNKGHTRITDWGMWYYTDERDSLDLNDKLIELLGNLNHDLSVWKELTEKYDAWIDVAGYMRNWTRGFSLKSEVMQLLVERNLEIVFDVYYESSEDENS
jgi:hypothetical protein